MVYVFKSPCAYKETLATLEATISAIGGSISPDLIAKWKRTALVTAAKVQFYAVSVSETETDVRAVFKNHSSDERFFWELFLGKLISLFPSLDFGITTEKPTRILAVLDLNGDTRTVYTSHTTGGASLGGFLLGGFVFGAPGAIVGGLSGKKRTRTTGFTEFSNSVCVRMVMSNGKLEERTVNKNDKHYHEIVMMMQRSNI